MGCFPKMTGSITDIAKAAGVSVTTVSRVFTGKAYVREDVRARVLAVAGELNYRPKSTARRELISFVSGGSLIGLYESALLSGFFMAARQENFDIDLVEISDLERVYRNFSRAIIAPVYSEARAQELQKLKNIFVITINHITPGMNYVCTDHFASGFEATLHLIRNGHRRIAIATAPFENNISWGEGERLRGYRAALEENKIPFDPSLIVYGARETPQKLIRLFLEERPTAIVASGEFLLLPVKYAIEILGKKIPKDISMIGFYSPGETPYLIPEITCIDQGVERIAKEAFSGAAALVQGKVKKVETMLPNRWIEGKSVRNLKQKSS